MKIQINIECWGVRYWKRVGDVELLGPYASVGVKIKMKKRIEKFCTKHKSNLTPFNNSLLLLCMTLRVHKADNNNNNNITMNIITTLIFKLDNGMVFYSQQCPKNS